VPSILRDLVANKLPIISKSDPIIEPKVSLDGSSRRITVFCFKAILVAG
jgi:hypothetical protein